MPVQLISSSLPSLLSDVIDQLLSGTAGTRLRVYEEVVEVEVGLVAGRGRVRVVVCEANRFAVAFLDGDGTADGIVGVKEAVEVGLGDVVGYRAFVESVVALPKGDPGLFVCGLDGADLYFRG